MVPRSLIRFAAVVLVPIVFLALLEGGLRLFGLGAPIAPVLGSELDASGEQQIVIRAPRTALMGRRQFNPQSVPARKAEAEYRVLLIGGSLTYGWPYDDSVSFPRLLAVGLAAVDSATPWRVVNLGAPGWGSSRLRAISEQLVSLDPDLVVVTTGNNEMLDALAGAGAPPPRSLTGQLLRQLYRRSYLVNLMATGLRPLAVSLLSGRARALHAVEPEGRAILVEDHAANLDALATTFRSAGARVYLSTVPVNLRGTRPFGEDAPGEPLGSDDTELARIYGEALALVEAGRGGDTRVALEGLVRRAPESARVAYLYARALEAGGHLAAARRAYTRALDLDRFPLRTFGALNRNAARVAAEKGIRLVDLAAAMAKASSDIVPGDDLFLDNAHPNRRGNAVLALAVAASMEADGVLAASAGWQRRFLTAVRDYLNELEIQLETRVAAQEFLLFYYREFDTDADRVRAIENRLQALRAGSGMPNSRQSAAPRTMKGTGSARPN